MLLYPVIVAAALAVVVLTSLVLGSWPPSLLGAPFQRGVVVGAAVVGALWWIRELAQILGAGAERDRKGAEAEELTAAALRPLRRHGWRVVHDVEYVGEGNVDHLLIGPGGVIALDSKYTSERLWVTPKAIGGSQRNFIGSAKRAARLARRALDDAGFTHLAVEPALVFWGPGAPEVPEGQMTIQNTWVLEGRKASRWRGALRNRADVLDRRTIKDVVGRIAASAHGGAVSGSAAGKPRRVPARDALAPTIGSQRAEGEEQERRAGP